MKSLRYIDHIALQECPSVKGQPPACIDLVDCCDLDPLTFTSELDLDMVVTYSCMLKIRSIGEAVQKLSSGKENETFGCCDLALDPLTFTSEPDLDMVVTYLHAKD